MSMNEEYQTLAEQTSLTEEEKARAEAFAGEYRFWYDSNAVLQLWLRRTEKDGGFF